ncbi:MAG: hypothetical protein IPQ05_06085 [Leptospiraceae bacterium]|nr:hypothetical protein [Leptospiraceae bacterium]
MWFRGLLLIAAILLIAKCSSASEKKVIKGKERILVLPIMNNTKAIKGDLDRNVNIALKQYGANPSIFVDKANVLKRAKKRGYKEEIQIIDEEIKYFEVSIVNEDTVENFKKDKIEIMNGKKLMEKNRDTILSRLEGIDEINRIHVQKKLSESNLFEVISIEDQKKALNSLKNCNTNNCALELGKILFAKYILNGEITYSSQLKSLCVILKLTDVDKGIYFTGYQKCFLADEKYLKEKGYYQDLYAEYNMFEPNSKTLFEFEKYLKDNDDDVFAVSKSGIENIYNELKEFASFNNVDAVYNGKSFLFNKTLIDIMDESFQELIKNYRKKIG